MLDLRMLAPAREQSGGERTPRERLSMHVEAIAALCSDVIDSYSQQQAGGPMFGFSEDVRDYAVQLRGWARYQLLLADTRATYPGLQSKQDRNVPLTPDEERALRILQAAAAKVQEPHELLRPEKWPEVQYEWQRETAAFHGWWWWNRGGGRSKDRALVPDFHAPEELDPKTVEVLRSALTQQHERRRQRRNP